MKDLYGLFKEILSIFGKSLTGWTVAIFILLYFLRDRITAAANNLLDLLGQKFASEVGSRRVESQYKEYVRAAHLHLKIVGIRTEEERTPKITDAYVPIKLLQRGDSIEHAVLVDQIIYDNRYNLILGGPGAGKSTILDYLTTEYTTVPPIKRAICFDSMLTLVPFKRKVSTPCPIYVPMRRCQARNKTLLADILDEETGILPEAVCQKMPKKFIEHCVKHGRAFLLLDGLDEVADEEAYCCAVQKVNTFVQLCPRNKVVVTCRKAGWRGGLNPDFQMYSALSLDSQQQYDFIHRWYKAILQYTSHGIAIEQNRLQRRAEREADQLLTLLRSKERLSELASNPLMLSLICLVHKQRKDLPRGRIALYQECLDILLELWDRGDKEIDQKYPTTEQKKLLLRRIAYRMHCTGVLEVNRSTLEDFVLEFLSSVKDRGASAEIIRQIEVRSGLMAERSINMLAFSHLTFQEFLVVDYINNEQDGDMHLKTITDWSPWREPTLLMCGTKNKPTPFIGELYTIQPLLALYGIVEADRTSLDMGIVQRIVDNMIDRIQKQDFELNEALPALIGLLSVEDNPFGESIIKFIHACVHGYSEEEVSNLMEALSKMPTKESAKIILSLLTRFDLSTVETILINGLARIGDAAIDEALEWRERDELSELQLFSILVTCHTPFATKLFWSRYQLEPPKGYELAWATSWASRLADQKNDEVLRPLTTSHTGVNDPLVWPYRQNDRSVIAAIIKKSYTILNNKYNTIDKIIDDRKIFSSFCLYLQVPMLIASEGDKVMDKEIVKTLYNYDLIEKKSGADPLMIPGQVLYHESSSANLPQDIEEMQKSSTGYVSTGEFYIPFIIGDMYDWYTLGYFIKRQKKPTILRHIMLFTGIAINLASLVLVSGGIIALLPPDGNILHFWAWLPLWGKVAAPAGWLTLTSSYMLYYMVWKEDMYKKLWSIVIITVGLISLAIVPMCWFYIPILNDPQKTFEKMVIFKKIIWRGFLYALGGSIITAIFGFLAIKYWLKNSISPYLCVPLLTAIVFLGIFLVEYAAAFKSNLIKEWLQEHPRGSEVLDEFAR